MVMNLIVSVIYAPQFSKVAKMPLNFLEGLKKNFYNLDRNC